MKRKQQEEERKRATILLGKGGPRKVTTELVGKGLFGQSKVVKDVHTEYAFTMIVNGHRHEFSTVRSCRHGLVFV